MPRLGVNIDHVATLRNARGGVHPCPIAAAKQAVEAGAQGITAHLREDRRHISDADVHRLHAEITVPLNLEMAATPEMQGIALRLKPHAVCIVPEKRAELTTEGGLDAAGQQSFLQDFCKPLQDAGIRVSLFIDPEINQLEAALSIGAPVIELHTGPYCDGNTKQEYARLKIATEHAQYLGLECHAGHGLNYETAADVAKLPAVAELNIGHFIIGEALSIGLYQAVQKMLQATQKPS